VTDPRFVDNEQRVNNRDQLMPLLIARTVLFSKADLIEKLEAAGVPVGPINKVPEVFRDPQVIARGMR
ncbi:CoA transferase, partial [Klebsiella pneumoniae]|uniref:CoA transferase n=1 Tax=Klebsiella pneumoniae TaxID=573 RepID=UPI001952FBB9